MSGCQFLNCREPGIWRDDDDGREYCGAHLIYVAPGQDDEARREIREEIADELRGERFDAIAARSF